MADFLREVENIDAEIKDLTWAGGLFKCEFFRKVHGAPGGYFETVKSALADPRVSEQQKIIMVLMMQKLPLEPYLDLSEYLFEILERGQISYVVFRWAVFPGYDWNTCLAENYQTERVRTMIGQFVASEKVAEKLKRYFQDEVLTGQANQQVFFLKDIGQIP